MRKLKEPTTMRLSERTKRLIALLAEKKDTTQTAIVQEAVRELAEREQVKIEDGPVSENDESNSSTK